MTVYQIAATADDGYWYTTLSQFENAPADGLAFGSYGGSRVNAFFRFVVTIPTGAIITTAKLSVYFIMNIMGGAGTADVYAVDAANPSAISSCSDGDGRAKTSASGTIAVATSGTWIDSSSLVLAIQELVDSHGAYESEAIELLVIGRDTGGFSGYHDYTSNAAKAGKLTLEYTEAAAGSRAFSPRRRSFQALIGR